MRKMRKNFWVKPDTVCWIHNSKTKNISKLNWPSEILLIFTGKKSDQINIFSVFKREVPRKMMDFVF